MERVEVIESKSPEETKALAVKMAAEAEPGDVYTLIGDLGVGKTLFASGFAEGLGITEPISSPTFTVICEYEEGRLPFYHMDAYRLEDPSEAEVIGVDEYLSGDGVCLIEWADQIEELIPEKHTRIEIEKDLEKGFDYRKITLRYFV